MWERSSRAHIFSEEVPPDPTAKRRSQRHVLRLMGVDDEGDHERDDEGAGGSNRTTGCEAKAHSPLTKDTEPRPSDCSVYGLGKDRTLEEFCKHCDVDFKLRWAVMYCQ
eukprot:1178427-Prorocentrum_minimum.AAC.2